MPNPRPAAEWAKNLVVDQIHGQYACECQYISKMCHHHEFQVTAISNALDAYARQQVEVEYCAAHGKSWTHVGCKVCITILHWEKQFEEVADDLEKCGDKAKQQVEAALDHAVAIQRKCEQYWNEHGVSDAEYHAALGFIYQEAAAIRTLKP